jgi:hypothetical protein
VAVQYFILSIVQILKKDEHNLLVNALDLILKISLKVCLFLSKKKKKKLVQNLSHVYEIKLKEKKKKSMTIKNNLRNKLKKKPQLVYEKKN